MSALSNWMKVFKNPPASFVDAEVPAGAVDGTNTAFTLVNTPKVGSVALFVDGIKAVAGIDYTVAGNTITLLFNTRVADVPNGISASQLVASYRF